MDLKVLGCTCENPDGIDEMKEANNANCTIRPIS
jgi:hypothetical protein